MNNGASNNKTLWVVGVLVVCGIIAYYGFSRSTGTDDTLDSTGVVNSQGIIEGDVGADIAALLAQLKTLNFDEAFFEDPSYKVLYDFTLEVPARPVGRANPFAPVRGAAPTTGSGIPAPQLGAPAR
jgi:hypothetical protein